MNELIFSVEQAPEGGYTARALGQSIFTEVDDLPKLHEQVRDATRCGATLKKDSIRRSSGCTSCAKK